MKKGLSAVALAAGVLLAGAFLAVRLHEEVKERALSQFSESQLLIAQQVAGGLTSYLSHCFQDVRYIAYLTSLEHLDVTTMLGDVQVSLEHLKAEEVEDVFVVGREGKVVSSAAGTLIGTNYAGSDLSAWAKEPAHKGMVRLVMEKPGERGTPVREEGVEPPPPRSRLSIATPLYHQEPVAGGSPGSGGTFVGTLLVTVDLEVLVKRTLALTPTTGSRSIWIMDGNGTLLLQSEHPRMVSRNLQEKSEECNKCHISFDHAEKMLAVKQGTLEYQLIGQQSKVAAFAPVTFEDVSWIVVVNAPKDDVTSFIQANFVRTLGLFGVVGLVLGVAFFFMYRTSSQQIVIAEKANHLQEKEQLLARERLAREILELLNRPVGAGDEILGILQLIKNGFNADAVGIRLREGDDYPYYKTDGFPEHFVEAERHLCASDEAGGVVRDGDGKPVLECLCGTVLCGRANAALPFFTEGGSFWTGSASDLAPSGMKDDRQGFTRNRCSTEGYESVALVPLRSGDEIVGLLQLSDHRRDRFAADVVRFLEGIGPSIGIALSRRQAEDLRVRLLHADRLASVGQLAAGVAHEVNNPATFVLANLSFLKEELAGLERLFEALRGQTLVLDGRETSGDALLSEHRADSRVREMRSNVKDSLEGVKRIVKIVRNLRTFSRSEREETEQVDVNEVIGVTCNMVFNEIRHRARLVKDLGNVPLIVADPSKLAQVFTNVLMNAAQAITEGDADHNKIRIITRTVGDTVQISIEDTGCGMPEHVRKRIFDPFFTTKRRGEGTGLGLSLCAEIVRQHRGTIDIDSNVGEGTRFVISLPIGTDAPIAGKKKADGRQAAAVPHHRARVLVVDDETALLPVFRRFLERHHEVVTASGGGEALALLEKDPGFDVIVCDLMMPDVDGIMVHEALQQRQPELAKRLIFSTGGIFTTRVSDYLTSTNIVCLEKPIQPELLLSIVDRFCLPAAAGTGGDSAAQSRRHEPTV